MLILRGKVNESIIISGTITRLVLEIGNDDVRH